MSDLSSKRPSAFLPAAGWVPLPGRSQVRLTGADRAKFLHNFCTNDIKKLQPGQGCEAFLTTIKGRILGHIFVFAGADDLMIDTVPGQDVKIRDHLDRYVITEDVQIEVQTDSFRCVYLFGSAWPTILHDGIALDVGGLAQYQQVQNEQYHLTIRRMDLVGTIGFEILMPPSAVDALMSAFQLREESGRPQQVAADVFNAFHIDAGFPTYGIDLTDDHLAQEAARTAQAISFTKGCYLGQEPIARIDALGHVNRELRVVAFDNAEALTAPCKVRDASTKAELGTLTSVGRVPDSATVGMGMVRTSAHPGTSIIASTDKGEFTGQGRRASVGHSADVACSRRRKRQPVGGSAFVSDPFNEHSPLPGSNGLTGRRPQDHLAVIEHLHDRVGESSIVSEDPPNGRQRHVASQKLIERIEFR